MATEQIVDYITSLDGFGAAEGWPGLCRSLLEAGLVDRYRVVVFPVVNGATGADRMYDGWPDVALELIETRTFNSGVVYLRYRVAR